MSWSEIKKAVNSDLNKPLNELIEEMLNNDSYGLSAIKNAIGSGGGGNSFFSNGFERERVDTDVMFKKAGKYIDITVSVQPCLLAFDGRINYFGNNSRYIYENGEFVYDSYCPFSACVATVHNNKIYAMDSSGCLYILTDGVWEKNSTSYPQSFGLSTAYMVSYNGSLYVSTSNNCYLYKWTGTSWTNLSSYVPSVYMHGSYSSTRSECKAVTVFDGYINVFFYGYDANNRYYDWYKYNGGSAWTRVTRTAVTNPYIGYVYDSKLRCVNNSGIYEWDGTTWTNIVSIDDACPYSSSLSNMALIQYNSVNIAVLSDGTICTIQDRKMYSCCRHRNSIYSSTKAEHIMFDIDGDIHCVLSGNYTIFDGEKWKWVNSLTKNDWTTNSIVVNNDGVTYYFYQSGNLQKIINGIVKKTVSTSFSNIPQYKVACYNNDIYVINGDILYKMIDDGTDISFSVIGTLPKFSYQHHLLSFNNKLYIDNGLVYDGERIYRERAGYGDLSSGSENYFSDILMVTDDYIYTLGNLANSSRSSTSNNVLKIYDKEFKLVFTSDPIGLNTTEGDNLICNNHMYIMSTDYLYHVPYVYKQLMKNYMPSGANIYFNKNLEPISNCEQNADGTLKVLNNGLVEFYVDHFNTEDLIYSVL